jgi:hypothetical protein
MPLGTLQPFDEGATGERPLMAITDAEGVVLAFRFPFDMTYTCTCSRELRLLWFCLPPAMHCVEDCR